jgi:hypothetical protein
MLTACSDAPGRPSADTTADSSGAAIVATPGAPAAPANADPVVADTTQPFDRPIVIYIDATSAEIDAARQGHSEEDFATIADDLMYYRSTANEFLAVHRLPVLRLEGRRPLRFMVDGRVQQYDFAEWKLFDLIIAYDGVHAPRVIAPIDVNAVVDSMQASTTGGD